MGFRKRENDIIIAEHWLKVNRERSVPSGREHKEIILFALPGFFFRQSGISTMESEEFVRISVSGEEEIENNYLAGRR